MFSARGPLGPWPVWNVTVVLHAARRNECRRTPTGGRRYSLPSEAATNPKPLSLTKRLTVPFIVDMCCSCARFQGIRGSHNAAGNSQVCAGGDSAAQSMSTLIEEICRRGAIDERHSGKADISDHYTSRRSEYQSHLWGASAGAAPATSAGAETDELASRRSRRALRNRASALRCYRSRENAQPVSSPFSRRQTR